jgi:hypothetical protein
VKQKIIATIVILGLLLTTVERTFAGLSDTETGSENFFETGSLDLKVAKVNSFWEGASFRDDQPYGSGLEPAFNETAARPGTYYESRYLLWNSGNINGEVYLRIRVDHDPENVASRSCLTAWYDASGDKIENASEIVNGTLAALSNAPVNLGALPAAEIRRLRLTLCPLQPNDLNDPGCDPTPFTLDFKTEFQLVQANARGFTDTEVSGSHLVGAVCERGGSDEFWRGQDALRQYGKCLIVSEFHDIVRHSNWFVDVHLTGDDEADYHTMVVFLTDTGGGNSYSEVVTRLRREYLATRLNAVTIPSRLMPTNNHNFSGVPGAAAFFGYGEATLATIITTIENNCVDGSIFNPPPSNEQVELMKNVCEALNDVRI